MINRSNKHSMAVELKTKLLIACGALLIAPCLMALRCGEIPLEENFEESDVIFSGSVTSINDSPIRLSAKWYLDGQEKDKWGDFLAVQFKVEDVWKGELDKQVLIYTLNSNWGYPFKVGNRYVVFADLTEREEVGEEPEEHLKTGWCSWNIGLGDGKTDVDLGEIKNNIGPLKELGNETTLVDRLEDLRAKLADSGGTEESKEDVMP